MFYNIQRDLNSINKSLPTRNPIKFNFQNQAREQRVLNQDTNK